MNLLISILFAADVVASTIKFVTTVSFDGAAWLVITHSSKRSSAAIFTRPIEMSVR